MSKIEENNIPAPIIMFAEKRDDGTFNAVFPTKLAVSLCSRKPPVRVSVTISKDGDYWGWDDGKEITMIFRTYLEFKTCFEYGVDAAESKGKGHKVRLKVEEYHEPIDQPEDQSSPSMA